MRMQIAMQMHNLCSWKVLQSVPSYLQRIHPQPLVHAWTIGEKGGQECLEAEAKVEHPVLHPLLEHAVLPRLADDQVRPLDDHDWDKEGSVAGVLEDLPIPVQGDIWSGLQEQKTSLWFYSTDIFHVRNVQQHDIFPASPVDTCKSTLDRKNLAGHWLLENPTLFGSLVLACFTPPPLWPALSLVTIVVG